VWIVVRPGFVVDYVAIIDRTQLCSRPFTSNRVKPGFLSPFHRICNPDSTIWLAEIVLNWFGSTSIDLTIDRYKRQLRKHRETLVEGFWLLELDLFCLYYRYTITPHGKVRLPRNKVYFTGHYLVKRQRLMIKLHNEWKRLFQLVKLMVRPAGKQITHVQFDALLFRMYTYTYLYNCPKIWQIKYYQ